MTTSEKVAYLKGLAEGLGLDPKRKEDKLLASVIDILEDLALEIEDLEENALDLGEEIDQISEDLSDLEDLMYEEEDDDTDLEDCHVPHHHGACCGHGKHHSDHGHGMHHDACDCGEDDDIDEPIFFEVKCPTCENEITIDEDVLNLGSISCPNCNETLEFDFDEDEDMEVELIKTPEEKASTNN